MPKFDQMLYPANLLQPGDIILTGNDQHPSSYTVVRTKRLVVCYEIICQPYRRFVVQPHDGLWIKWSHEAAVRARLAQEAAAQVNP